MRRFGRDERGQSLVLIAGSLPLILVLLLVVIDGGRLYVERERIRNAAQLAAEAAVSLAGDAGGGSRPGERQVREIVAEALERNLPGVTYTYAVLTPFQPSLPEFNVKVTVTEQFQTSIKALRFGISAEAAAKLGAGAQEEPGVLRARACLVLQDRAHRLYAVLDLGPGLSPRISRHGLFALTPVRGMSDTGRRQLSRYFDAPLDDDDYVHQVHAPDRSATIELAGYRSVELSPEPGCVDVRFRPA